MPHQTAATIRVQLAALAYPERAQAKARFFQTGKGQYAEGDIFWGISNADVRCIAQIPVPLAAVDILLADPVHEVRLCALLMLVRLFRHKKASEETRRAVIELYCARTAHINNWDLVDLSAAILGEWLLDKDRSLLYALAQSSNMWEQRIAVVATHVSIRQGDFTDILALADMLLGHTHHLMHKAIGWMLREVGKRDTAVLEDFLARHIRRVPRTTLRYAIERMTAQERAAWLAR